MTKSHIGHDSKIKSKSKITSLVQIGGYSTIGYGVNIGLSVSLHQWSVVGAYSMIGMNSTVTRNIPPGSLAVGSPARIVGPNKFSLGKVGITDTNFWGDYMLDIDCLSTPNQLIPHVDFFKQEVLDKIQQKELVGQWRKDALTLNRH